MIRTVVNVLGAVMLVVGLIGFVNHDFMGMHLNPMHNLIHLVTGIGSLYFGIKGTDRGLRIWCRTFGLVYALLGLVGIFMGPGTVTLRDLAGQTDSHLWKMIPKHLEFGFADSIVHILTGIVFLAMGLIPASVDRDLTGKAGAAKERVTTQ
jgi:hypothetical protein